MKLGDRVFVGGTTGRFGTLTSIQNTSFGPTKYYVLLDGQPAHSGPFTDVRPA